MEKREGNKRVRGGDRVSEIEKEGKIKSSLKEEYRNNELGWGERQKKGQRQADIKIDRYNLHKLQITHDTYNPKTHTMYTKTDTGEGKKKNNINKFISVKNFV